MTTWYRDSEMLILIGLKEQLVYRNEPIVNLDSSPFNYRLYDYNENKQEYVG